MRVHIISISWGISEDVPPITTALNSAIEAGILIFASASNSGANYHIPFPACLHEVFCIGSSDGLGHPSSFNPPFGGVEKYSVLGESVSGACPKSLCDHPGYDAITQTVRRDGTSTAAPIAAGIAAIFVDYTWQFMEGKGACTYENIRKLFTRMSRATIGKDYRYLAPWSLFGAGRDSTNDIKKILTIPLGIKLWYNFILMISEQDKLWTHSGVLGTRTGSRWKFIEADCNIVNDPILVPQKSPEPTAHFAERKSVSLNYVRETLSEHHRVVISGLPGVGKSELASQVIRRVKAARTYKGIFWLSSATEATLHAGIYELARKLNLIDDSNTDIDTVRNFVLHELEMQDHWLMVLDNVDDVDLIRNFLPSRDGSRHVLITSRYREAHSALNAIPIPLETLSDGEA